MSFKLLKPPVLTLLIEVFPPNSVKGTKNNKCYQLLYIYWANKQLTLPFVASESVLLNSGQGIILLVDGWMDLGAVTTLLNADEFPRGKVVVVSIATLWLSWKKY